MKSGPTIRQDRLRPLAQIIIVRFADALSQLADFGTALLNGSSLNIQSFSLGLHFCEAVDEWRKIDACGPNDGTILAVASALAVDPRVADDEACLLQFVLSRIDGARGQAQGFGKATSLRPHRANASGQVVAVHCLARCLPVDLLADVHFLAEAIAASAMEIVVFDAGGLAGLRSFRSGAAAIGLAEHC